MIREIASLFSRTLIERRASVRRKYQIPVRVCFAPEKKNTVNLTTSCDEQFLSGETIDVSETGIGFVVSTIRIKEKYLVGQDRELNVELDLSGRKVMMRVIGRRYEKVGIHVSTEKYLIGAEITEMRSDDRLAYEVFLKGGKESLKSAAPAFGLSID